MFAIQRFASQVLLGFVNPNLFDMWNGGHHAQSLREAMLRQKRYYWAFARVVITLSVSIPALFAAAEFADHFFVERGVVMPLTTWWRLAAGAMVWALMIKPWARLSEARKKFRETRHDIGAFLPQHDRLIKAVSILATYQFDSYDLPVARYYTHYLKGLSETEIRHVVFGSLVRGGGMLHAWDVAHASDAAFPERIRHEMSELINWLAADFSMEPRTYDEYRKLGTKWYDEVTQLKLSPYELPN